MTAWVIVSTNAPPINNTLRVNLYSEVSQGSSVKHLQITKVKFSGSGTTIRVTLNNTGTMSVTITEAYVNDAKNHGSASSRNNSS